MPTRRDATAGSVLWAAYGDALGFVSELVDSSGLRRRSGLSEVTRTVPWQYRAGGRFGAIVQLPAGSYSDDTQLRLATSRAISRGGEFNVDAFSKVELPVWLSYALGGGVGTKAAATNLVRGNVTWFANFYSAGTTKYVNGGGNGAAMRIQPHVWSSAQQADANGYVLNVVRNTVTTHGHPRAIVGSVLYALALEESLNESSPVPIDRCLDYLHRIGQLPALLAEDHYLSSMWVPEWERRTGERFSSAIQATIEECRSDIRLASIASGKQSLSPYLGVLDALGAFASASRGSGTKSVIAALTLAWVFRREPEEGLRQAANALGSDTDTIASMAGALLGCNGSHPPGELQDRGLLLKEADRLTRIADGGDIHDFPYPSLIEWTPPKSASDAVGEFEGGLAVVGLGKLNAVDDRTFAVAERDSVSWKWMRTAFDQTILIKMQASPAKLNAAQMPVPRSNRAVPRMGDNKLLFSERPASRASKSVPKASTASAARTQPLRFSAKLPIHRPHDDPEVDELVRRAMLARFSSQVIGDTIRRLLLLRTERGEDLALRFLAAVAVALHADTDDSH